MQQSENRAISVAQTKPNNPGITSLDSKNVFHMLALASLAICVGIWAAWLFSLYMYVFPNMQLELNSKC